MTDKIEMLTRKQIIKFLPDAIETAIASYREFSEEEVTAPKIKEEESTVHKAKDFKDHHGACKVALAHIELLLKLAKLADLPDSEFDNQSEHKALLGLIEAAQGELRGSNKN